MRQSKFASIALCAAALGLGACGSSGGDDGGGGEAASAGDYGTGLELGTRVLSSAKVGAAVAPWYRWNNASCGFEVAEDHPSEYRADVREVTGGDAKIGYMHYGNTDPFGIDNSRSIERVAKEAGMELDVYNLRYPSRTEPNNAANSAIVKRNRGLIQANLDVSLLPGFHDIVEGEGCMPSIQLYVAIEGRPAMGNHWPDVGTEIGEFVATSARERGWSPRETALVQCTDPDNGPSVNAMFETVKRAVADSDFGLAPGDVHDIVCKQSESQSGYKRVTDWLTAHPQYRHVAFTAIDSIRMQEMIRAIGESDLADADTLTAAGADDESSRRSVRAGTQDMSVAFFGERFGEYAIPMLQDLMAGNAVPSFLGTELVQLTRDTIDDYYPGG
ncbi:hypothetical protein [Conexibacter arvalis]|uniref:Ribose transport system substrate-binding protein n=1 Tax=Conexibacter arvalis TaxID=912552 RepID=A0A840I6L9_9ACTN|nr:ribose transport system substrate-binding protein [Conexibacter arvalis]